MSFPRKLRATLVCGIVSWKGGKPLPLGERTFGACTQQLRPLVATCELDWRTRFISPPESEQHPGANLCQISDHSAQLIEEMVRLLKTLGREPTTLEQTRAALVTK
jgi:hypothetical protein